MDSMLHAKMQASPHPRVAASAAVHISRSWSYMGVNGLSCVPRKSLTGKR